MFLHWDGWTRESTHTQRKGGFIKLTQDDEADEGISIQSPDHVIIIIHIYIIQDP